MTHSSPTEPARDKDPKASRATIGERLTSHGFFTETKASTETAPEEFPEEEKQALPPTKGRWKSRLKSGWPTFAALAIALIAVGLAIVAWFRPFQGASFTNQQITDAKNNVCAAYADVRQGVAVNTHRKNPRGGDPIGSLAVAANARLALLGGGLYLQNRLAAEPAAPADLANALKSLADAAERLGASYVAGGPDAAQAQLRDEFNSQVRQVNQLCA